MSSSVLFEPQVHEFEGLFRALVRNYPTLGKVRWQYYHSFCKSVVGSMIM